MLQFILIIQIVMSDGTLKQRGAEHESLEACIAAQNQILTDMKDTLDDIGARSIAAGCSIRRKQIPS